MSNGFLRSLLKLSGRGRRIKQVASLGASGRRPFLESLETRSLPSVFVLGADITAPPVTAVTQNTGPVGSANPSSNMGGQSETVQTELGSKGTAQLTSGASIHVTIRQTPVSLQPIGDANSTGDNEQAQDDSGQGDGQTDAQGGQGDQGVNPADGQDGQDNSSDNGQGSSQLNGQGDTGDQGTSQVQGQSGQSDDGSASTGTGQEVSTPTSTGTGSDDVQDNRPRISTPDGQGDNPQLPLDTDQSGMAINGLVSSSTGKTTSSSAGSPGDSPNGATVSSTEGLNSATNTQSGTGDKRLHGPTIAAVPDGEQRGPLSAPDGKHGVDAGAIQGDDTHSPIPPGTLEPRIQVGAQVQHGAEDPGQRQVQERFVFEDSPRLAIVEPYGSNEKVLHSVSYLPGDTLPDNDAPELAPQNHGLLTDRLFLDFASLSSEVQRFFAQIDELGVRGTERKIGMVLCTGALVAAAAMACEVARRQARRQVLGPMIGQNPELELGNEADDPSDIGLPNLAQFSIFP
jgi:hypothetical protein